MTHREEYQLGEVADINWGDTKITKRSYTSVGFPAYSAAGQDGFLPYYDFSQTGVVLSAIGANCGQTWLARGRWSCIKNTIRFWSTSEAADTEYLYWLTRDPDFWPKRGSVQPFIAQSDARSIRVSLPPISEQKATANLLTTLQNKIELNRRMNQTLEAMARAIFKDWFVDFGPTRAKAVGRASYLTPEVWSLFPDALDEEGKPAGWIRQSISEFTEIIYGAAFSSKHFNADKRGMPLIRIRDLVNHEPKVFTEESHKKGHLIEPGDIVVGMDGEFCLQIWKGPRAWLNQRVCHFRPRVGLSTSFLAEALREPLAFFEHGKIGTTVIHLGKADIDTIKLIDPGMRVLRAFSASAQPLVDMTVANSLESRTLTHIRDRLLPKLMSGEMRVADAGAAVEAVA